MESSLGLDLLKRLTMRRVTGAIITTDANEMKNWAAVNLIGPI